MTERDRKLAVVASLLVTVTVGANMVAFQDRGPVSFIETGGLAEKSGWVETASLTPGSATESRATEDQAVPPAVSVAAAPKADPSVNMVELTRAVQRELNARGYEAGPTDGSAGLVTRAAIFAYEYDNDLLLTAMPSEPLLRQIILGSSSLSSNGGRTGKAITADGQRLVRSVKQQLTALDYQPGKVDGTLTPELARTIRKFEADQKLKQSGRISGPLMSRLIRLEGQAKARSATAQTATQ
jgi:peptidoglycan hydrolase-like protein with peptidoglycan-binding domain